jgi:GxxExxY protein
VIPEGNEPELNVRTAGPVNAAKEPLPLTEFPVNLPPVNLDPRELPHLIVGACMEVHRHLGPGLMADAYCDCLAIELRMKELVFRRKTALPFTYKGQKVESGVAVDFLVEESVIVTVESVGSFTPEHKNRLKSLLRLTGYEVGLLVNFNVDNLRDGVKRIIVAEQPPALHYREEPQSGSQAHGDSRPTVRNG